MIGAVRLPQRGCRDPRPRAVGGDQRRKCSGTGFRLDRRAFPRWRRVPPQSSGRIPCRLPLVLVQDENRWVRTFRRYVAIGDSSTEGLEDRDGESGYRGWADRLAEIIANAQADPLDYANLGVPRPELTEIRTTQFPPA